MSDSSNSGETSELVLPESAMKIIDNELGYIEKQECVDMAYIKSQ